MSADPLRVVRLLLAAQLVVVVAATAAGVAVASGADLDEQVSPVVAVGVVLVVIVGTALASRLVRRPLPTGAVEDAIAALHTQLIVELALAETPALVGFALALAAADPLPVLVGGPVALLALLAAAPTRRRLEAAASDLAVRGAGFDLVAALDPAVVDGPLG